MSTSSRRYLFASTQAWHRPRYEALRQQLSLDAAWVSTPAELKDAVRELAPRYVFFPHWSAMVPPEVWREFECVCFHMTDLPFGRGGSPLQNLIARGHEDTVLTALRMNGELDAGPIYAKRPLSLAGSAQEIYARAGDATFELIRWIIESEPTPHPQVGEPVHFKRRTPGQSRLPESDSLTRLYDHIRMLDAPGYPAAFLEWAGLRFEFSDATLEGDELVAKVVVRKPSHGDGG
jgi:methionyl-tRNA formyltransferase